MEETVNQFTIAELIRRGRPLTAASALNSSPNPSVPAFSSTSRSLTAAGTTVSSNSSHNKILSPLTHRTILTGTVILPTAETLKCPNKNCFKFSDGSTTICCDILHFSVRVIGNKIRVLSWNFIPLKHSPYGFLEIIKYSFPYSVNSSSSSSVTLSRCSDTDSIPIVLGSSSSLTASQEDKLKARYHLNGTIESISPVSVVPCSIGDGKSSNLRGFIAQIRVCECKLCSDSKGLDQQYSHSFTKPVFVYFYGSFSSWHPVITKLVRKVVTLSGLKKKLVFTGKEESRLMFAITEISVIRLLTLYNNRSPCSNKVVLGKGECGDYKGVVSGVYMQGMVVELDKEVWVLLTDQLLVFPHSLRVGAIVSLRNVHFVNPKFTWTKMLIIGACFKTSITVESFSPLETGCSIISQSQSQLGKFIKSLSFSTRMWALLVISSFRKKFTAILSEKDILGSDHKKGLAHIFASSHVPPSMIRARHGILTEVCKHDTIGCGGQSNGASLKLVPAISTFLQYCEATWTKEQLRLENNCDILCNNSQPSLLSHKGRSNCQTLRRIFRSEDIGVSLLGSLKISPSSGRLQFVDATGSIDTIIPDLPSTWKPNVIYEVVNYSLIMEGTPDLVDNLGLPVNESFSCRHIFHCIPWAKEMNLAVYMYFCLSSATCKNFPLYPSVGWNYECKELQSGRFHLICTTHKYPVLQKFQGEPLLSDRSTSFAEAIIMPWDLFLAEKEGTPFIKVSDWSNEPLARYCNENCQELPPNKKCKTDQASSQTFASDLMKDCSYGCCELSTYCSSFGGCTEGKCGNLSSFEIPCSVTVRIGNICNFVRSGKLRSTRSKKKTGTGFSLRTEKVLLEFNSENFFKYQMLQIGSYYVIKHDDEEPFCCIKDRNYVGGTKVLISSRMHMWSLSFSSDEVTTENKTSDDPSQNDSSFSSREYLGRIQVSDKSLEKTCSDVHLCLAANALCIFDVKLNTATKGADVNPPIKKFNDSCDLSNTITSSNFSSGYLDNSFLLPEGNLTSVCGDVVAIHGFEDNSGDVSLSCERIGGILDIRFSQGSTSNYCIHVLVDNQMVNIVGSLSKHAFPVGFGPDVNATFHRILEVRETNKLRLTSVSFIVLNSIRVSNEPFRDRSSNIQSKCKLSSASSPDNISYGTISELIQFTDCKPMQFNCRVVAVHVLVLEKNRKYSDLTSAVQSKTHFIDIPIAGFVLDDGSSTCCCWANAERAAALLRLHEELPPGAFESSGCTFMWVGIEKRCWKSNMFHLKRILRKHDRISIGNRGSIIESSYQDLTVSLQSDNTLSISDENLLKFIVFNACFGTLWTVVASVMDPKSVKQLEKEHLMQMEMTVLPTQNVWAMEVQRMDTLCEARNMMKKLLNG